MATVPTGVSCPLPSEAFWTRLSRNLNTTWHRPALYFFTFIVLAHWAEHFVQAYQVYVLGWPLNRSFGLVGMVYPWLVKTEAMHYAYAFVMLFGLWILRRGFTGRAYVWWMIAFWIQFWHHIEHALLQGQVIYGNNFFNAPGPISIIQMLGFIEGPAATGFNGLLVGPPRHDMSGLLYLVRRMEVHMIYNTIVTVPMLVAMYYHSFPSPEEEQHMGCGCSLNRKPAAEKA